MFRCPNCNKEVNEKTQGVWPFCSPRCKSTDLGRWAKEEYRIPGKVAEPDAVPTQSYQNGNGNFSEED